MSEPNLLEGLITKAQSGFFTVQTDEGPIVAKLRGRLMKERMETDAAALGDKVTLSVLDDGTATIEEVAERIRVLSRQTPGRVEIEQVLVANPDQVVIVFACADPDPNFRLLDRILVMAASASLIQLSVVH